MIRVGVDVGGTFTDIVLERSGGAERQVVVTKVSSTPHDQSEGVVEGILKVAALAGVEPGAIDAVFHGTTVATNMVIERDGREGRHDHDAWLPRHHAYGPPQAAAQFLAAVRPALAVKAAGSSAGSLARHRAHNATVRCRSRFRSPRTR